MKIALRILMGLIILGHFFFAYKQWFDWPALCDGLSQRGEDKCSEFEFLGHSIASYNAAIAIGLLASLKLDDHARFWVQGVTLALIVMTAAVGVSGTGSMIILGARLVPAALALILLIFLNRQPPVSG